MPTAPTRALKPLAHNGCPQHCRRQGGTGAGRAVGQTSRLTAGARSQAVVIRRESRSLDGASGSGTHHRPARARNGGRPGVGWYSSTSSTRHSAASGPDSGMARLASPLAALPSYGVQTANPNPSLEGGGKELRRRSPDPFGAGWPVPVSQGGEFSSELVRFSWRST